MLPALGASRRSEGNASGHSCWFGAPRRSEEPERPSRTWAAAKFRTRILHALSSEAEVPAGIPFVPRHLGPSQIRLARGRVQRGSGIRVRETSISFPGLLVAISSPKRTARVRKMRASWLRTKEVNTNGAAAKVMFLDRLGKKVRKKGTPWHFWEDTSRLTGVPNRSLCQKNLKFAVTP